jgi:hypothetical protein
VNPLRSAARRPLLRVLLLLALAVRALMPAGVMASAADGALTLQLCTAAGIESVTLPGTPPPADRHIDGACLGALSDGNPLAVPPVRFAPVSPAHVVAGEFPRASCPLPAIQRSQSPRGPPAPELPR